MAMMMTGRVLLVCALCVLWCGAVLGHAMEDYCGEGGGNGLRQTSNGDDDGVSLKADCGLLSIRMALIKAVEAGEKGLSDTAPPQDNSKASSPENKVGNNTKSTGAPDSKGGSVAGEPAEAAPTPGESDTEEKVVKPEGLDANGGKKADGKRDRNDGTATGPQHQRADQPSSSSSSGSSGTESAKQPLVKENSERNETLDDPPQEEEKDRGSESDSHEEEAEELEKKEDKKNASNQAPTETLGGLTKHTEIHTATTEPNGQSSPQALGDVEQPEEVQRDIESNNNSQTKSVASIAANQQNEPSADHGESGSPSPTANGDAANNDSDNSTEDGIPNSDPAADVAETREKQNENKDANPKETPVEATAMKNTTATAGDSDGSTAVSHTTSPLLLLVVFACAAAAAVVAA
ncbi:mucin-associated surface protein (MASP), putative [Trypanosoma cruzi]|uniref:Mucin-associated surface protein (MASP), putative n=1 Tax=Trypanosoma cruzi (strain CL Brener) TaxID=353153 RepID=Q4DWD5_TRYCC|nr:mucin-associated surface protein (MASP), putative [Trypanosoma cruzi]EAN96844.1 mucin-associated surface protein (MASP), putative [Trypanosoma cruzi]|eukprot:XP_818695.1 mucin-associated surface protein (MASP) [Trypanosoma cruzi strain CL Brener]